MSWKHHDPRRLADLADIAASRSALAANRLADAVAEHQSRAAAAQQADARCEAAAAAWQHSIGSPLFGPTVIADMGGRLLEAAQAADLARQHERRAEADADQARDGLAQAEARLEAERKRYRQANRHHLASKEEARVSALSDLHLLRRLGS